MNCIYHTILVKDDVGDLPKLKWLTMQIMMHNKICLYQKHFRDWAQENKL